MNSDDILALRRLGNMADSYPTTLRDSLVILSRHTATPGKIGVLYDLTLGDLRAAGRLADALAAAVPPQLFSDEDVEALREVFDEACTHDGDEDTEICEHCAKPYRILRSLADRIGDVLSAKPAPATEPPPSMQRFVLQVLDAAAKAEGYANYRDSGWSVDVGALADAGTDVVTAEVNEVVVASRGLERALVEAGESILEMVGTIDTLVREKNAVYEERNLVVLLLAALVEAFGEALPADESPTDAHSWWADDPAADVGYRTVVFVEIDEKQMSWHLPEALGEIARSVLGQWTPENEMLAGASPYDGHTTKEKYERVRTLIREL